jgi:hypothetical protein
MGWEGDNFLSDSSELASLRVPSHRPMSVWFYCKPDHKQQVCDTVSLVGSPFRGTFTGYFHFVPDQKSRMKDVFDPGPLQLEIAGIFELRPNAKPDPFGSANPYN